MNNEITLNIWDRKIVLPVVYQNYPGEEIIDNQNKTVSAIHNVDFGLAKSEVVDFIKKNNAEDITETEITNLFRYVMPKAILVAREFDKRVFAVMCNYKFDMEHGLAIVFENERFKLVGRQDIIL